MYTFCICKTIHWFCLKIGDTPKYRNSKMVRQWASNEPHMDRPGVPGSRSGLGRLLILRYPIHSLIHWGNPRWWSVQKMTTIFHGSHMAATARHRIYVKNIPLFAAETAIVHLPEADVATLWSANNQLGYGTEMDQIYRVYIIYIYIYILCKYTIQT